MNPSALRQHVLTQLDGGRAHMRAREVLADFPARQRGARPRGFQHSAWQLLEHLRIAQRDILQYCRDPGHESPAWPEGFWPETPAPPDGKAWDKSARAFLADLRGCLREAKDRKDLLAAIPHAGVSWLHELLLIADHNSWHLGQLLQLRRALEA
jgi:hypothetical protein